MSATRAKLPDFTQAYPAALDEWLSLASARFSAEGVAGKVKEIQESLADTQARIGRLPCQRISTFLLTTGTLITLAFVAAVIAPEVGTYCWWCSAALFVAAVALGYGHDLGSKLRAKANAMAHRLTRLVPIAGTAWCQDALKYVQSAHPEVLAWRDMAIADRGQLYVFDVEIMAHLYHVAEQGKAAGDQKRLNEEACRMVHGITPATA